MCVSLYMYMCCLIYDDLKFSEKEVYCNRFNGIRSELGTVSHDIARCFYMEILSFFGDVE